MRGRNGDGTPQRGVPSVSAAEPGPGSVADEVAGRAQSPMRSLTTMVWSRSGPTPMAENRVPESFSRART